MYKIQVICLIREKTDTFNEKRDSENDAEK